MVEKYILPIAIMGIVAGLIAFALSWSAKKFEVKQDPLFVKVKEIIGDINCGACGYAGCAGYTKALTTFEDNLGKCRPMQQESYDKIDALLKEAKKG
ncbi:MAG: Fe-S protein [Firmicutes bacterium]|nr:Fe-S protein [Bacillota bacterium]MCL1953233.1 Fe-S protein [Bacillota bacterium]